MVNAVLINAVFIEHNKKRKLAISKTRGKSLEIPMRNQKSRTPKRYTHRSKTLTQNTVGVILKFQQSEQLVRSLRSHLFESLARCVGKLFVPRNVQIHSVYLYHVLRTTARKNTNVFFRMAWGFDMSVYQNSGGVQVIHAFYFISL